MLWVHEEDKHIALCIMIILLQKQILIVNSYGSDQKDFADPWFCKIIP